MKHRHKRSIIILTAAATAVCAVPQLPAMPALLRPAITAFAAETVTENGITYALYEDHAVIYKMERDNASTLIEIPSQINGLPVTEVGKNAFAAAESLLTVKLPDSITVIRESAFSGCTNLCSCVLPDHLTVIEASAFNYCLKLYFPKLPETLTYIGDSAFYHSL